MDPRAKAELVGVPETALWNLYQRASAARAGWLDDPRAVEAQAAIDYPFGRFAMPYQSVAARLHALRVRTMDMALSRLLTTSPDATVVALGEGFETQFWRVDNGRLGWLSVDLPEVATVRSKVLPDAPRNRTLASSAADRHWTTQVDRERAVIVTAQGLLPYFTPDQVHRMLCTWAELLPGAWLLFDAVTEQMQELRRRNPLPDGYQPPDWTWTLDAGELRRVRDLPGLADLREVPQAGGDWQIGILRRIPAVKSLLPTFPVLQVRF